MPPKSPRLRAAPAAADARVARPVALARFDADAVLVGKAGGGLVRIRLANGVADRLGSIEGMLSSVAVGADGAVLALDVSGARVVRDDRLTGAQQAIATGLRVGRLTSAHLRSGGLAAAPDGSIYVAADGENSNWGLRR